MPTHTCSFTRSEKGKRVSSVFTPETGAHVGGVANRAPHHSACEHCAGSAVQRTCGKCNRSARSLPGAAGPVRPAANTATATVHTTFTPEQIRWAFSDSESFGGVFDSLTTGVTVIDRSISFITE